MICLDKEFVKEANKIIFNLEKTLANFFVWETGKERNTATLTWRPTKT